MKYAIDVKKKVLINGLMQKIHVIGTKQSNPILLFLHGGPGVCGRHNVIGRDCDLADDFTLVAWDQRGTGGSYKGATVESMTLDNVIEDARQLVEYLCTEFGKKKIFIIGGSWGTELGTFLAHRHPERIAAYVGFGQVVNGVKNEEISYQFTLDRAREADDRESLEILAKYGPPEKGQYKRGLEGLMAQRKILEKYGGHSTKSKSMWKSTVKPILFSREYSAEDKIGIIKGYKFCLVNLWPTITDYDFVKTCNTFEMPYFIFQGRLDFNTASSLVQGFYDAIKAPQKDLIWFENSAHSPLGEEGERFKTLLREKLLKIKTD